MGKVAGGGSQCDSVVGKGGYVGHCSATGRQNTKRGILADTDERPRKHSHIFLS